MGVIKIKRARETIISRASNVLGTIPAQDASALARLRLARPRHLSRFTFPRKFLARENIYYVPISADHEFPYVICAIFCADLCSPRSLHAPSAHKTLFVPVFLANKPNRSGLAAGGMHCRRQPEQALLVLCAKKPAQNKLFCHYQASTETQFVSCLISSYPTRLLFLLSSASCAFSWCALVPICAT